MYPDPPELSGSLTNPAMTYRRLAAMLGSPTRHGKEALADCLARAGRCATTT